MSSSTLSQRIDALFEPFNRSDTPGAVVGVSHRGQVIYRKGFGMASLEHAVANTPSTRMRIGSTTKQYTCLGILLLEQDGLLDVHAPARDYLPELDNVYGQSTLLQLMHHSSGLPDLSMAIFLANGGQFGHMPANSTLPLLGKLRSQNFAPGRRMAYNNDGYTLLSLIIERLSKQSLQEFMRERIFAPLGMNSTELLRSDLDIAAGMATLHVDAGSAWRRGIYISDDLLGSGGVISTVDDMLRWTAHLRGTDSKVLTAALRSRLLEHQRFDNGKSLCYGLGLMSERRHGVEIVHHAGATLGAHSQMLLAPDHELDIIVLTNRMDAPAAALALRILDTVLAPEAPGEIADPPTAADHSALSGRWFSHASHTLLSFEPAKAQTQQAASLTVSVYNAPGLPLQPCEGGLQRGDGPFSSIEIFDVPPVDEPTANLVVHICGDAEQFVRLPAIPPAVEALAPALCGRYRYRDLGKEVEIRLGADGLILDLLPLCGFAQWDLTPYAEDVLGCGKFRSLPSFPLPLTATLTLDRVDSRVSGFWLDTDRMRNVRFDRC